MSQCILARCSIGVEAFTSLWKALCVSFIFFGPFQKTTLVPCPPSWAEAQCSEQCVGSGLGLQQVRRLSPACLSAVHLSKQPGCRRPCITDGLFWAGKQSSSWALGLFFFPPCFVCLATCKRALKRGQCMDFMVKRNHWRAGHRFCLLLLLLSLFNYLCSKWMKQLWVQGREEVQPSWCKYQSAV